eukprot:scaffold2567_cov188-Prasinococcus_capsulatus_cf.AAC.1
MARSTPPRAGGPHSRQLWPESGGLQLVAAKGRPRGCREEGPAGSPFWGPGARFRAPSGAKMRPWGRIPALSEARRG